MRREKRQLSTSFSQHDLKPLSPLQLTHGNLRYQSKMGTFEITH
jgi:hypothetical protein